MTLEQLRNMVRQHKGRLPDLALLSGVPISTVQKISAGTYKDAKASTIELLAAGCRKMPKRPIRG